MEKKEYDYNSKEFLNAGIDEIYHKKTHYINGRCLLDLKGAVGPLFVQVERIFRSVYVSGIVLDSKEIDVSLFQRQFPYLYEKLHEKFFLISDGQEEKTVDGIYYYTWLLQQLRNINVHAIIRDDLCKTFAVREDFLEIFMPFPNGIIFQKNGVLTIAGMFALLFSILHPKQAGNFQGYIISNWRTTIFGEDKSKDQINEYWQNLKSLYQTNYEVLIREKEPSYDIVKDVFGRIGNKVDFSGSEFKLDLSEDLNVPYYKEWGTIRDNGDNTAFINIKKGSNVGIDFEEDYRLEIKDVNLFCEFAVKVPPLMAIAYLYAFKKNVFNQEVYDSIDLNSFCKLNQPKFYRDKNVIMLTYGASNPDLRETNNIMVSGVLKFFLSIKEKVHFTKNIYVDEKYSKMGTVARVLNLPEELMWKIFACRNYCAHEGLINTYHYGNEEHRYKITLSFIFTTLKEFIDYLKESGNELEYRQARLDYLDKIMNHIVGSKYKRVFVDSIKLFRSKREATPEFCKKINASMKMIYNSVLDTETELGLKLDEEQIYKFKIPTSLLELENNGFVFKKLNFMVIKGEGLEIRGIPIPGKGVGLFRTPAYRLRKITQYGKPIELELMETEERGIMVIETYQAKQVD